MATVVGVMDRHSWKARTDNIVIVDPEAELLLWIPRDLWCDRLRNRINSAFALGGHAGLIGCLNDLGFSPTHSICVRREAVEHAVRGLEISVPVSKQLEFWYPLEPRLPLEQGRKLIRFRPPAELLSGERIHQWLGARTTVEDEGASDLNRIERQQIFVQRLMQEDFDFRQLLSNPEWISASSDEAFDELRQVRPTWRFDVYGDGEFRVIEGRYVFVALAPYRR